MVSFGLTRPVVSIWSAQTERFDQVRGHASGRPARISHELAADTGIDGLAGPTAGPRSVGAGVDTSIGHRVDSVDASGGQKSQKNQRAHGRKRSRRVPL